jgi:hypothetical protein
MVIVMVLAGLAGLSALALTVALLAAIDTGIDAAARGRTETQVVAEAGVAMLIARLAAEPDWSAVLAGDIPPHRLSPAVPPSVASWGPLDPIELTTRLQRESDAHSRWPGNDPVWRLYQHGRLADVLAQRPLADSPYVVVWVADDEADADGDPRRDANHLLEARVDAFGTGRAHHVVLVTLRRRPHGVEQSSWRVPADR